MNISTGLTSLRDGFNSKSLKTSGEVSSLNEVSEDSLEKMTSQSMTVATISHEAIARNTSSGEDDSSKYVKAKIAGFQQQNTIVNRQNSALNAAMVAGSNAESMTERVLAGKRAARSIMQEMQTSVMEKGQEVLKENQEAIDDRTTPSSSDAYSNMTTKANAQETNSASSVNSGTPSSEGSDTPSSTPVDVVV